jgi:hypothetical protein
MQGDDHPVGPHHPSGTSAVLDDQRVGSLVPGAFPGGTLRRLALWAARHLCGEQGVGQGQYVDLTSSAKAVTPSPSARTAVPRAVNVSPAGKACTAVAAACTVA